MAESLRGSKVCKKCGSSEFIPNGKYSRCGPCYKEYKARHYSENKDRIDAVNAKWASDNREASNAIKKKWRDTNKERDRASRGVWRSQNVGKTREYCSYRRTGIKQATPAWADREEIRRIHQLASERGLVVDHIVPLNSPHVCGLNVPDNLRCISPELNAKKGNRYWPDMPTELREKVVF